MRRKPSCRLGNARHCRRLRVPIGLSELPAVGMCGGAESFPGMARRSQGFRPGTKPAETRVSFLVKLHHHYSAPNRSRLGVFVCGIRAPRGTPARSACATRRSPDRHHAPSSPLFRPIFSRNLRQLLRRGTRRRRFPSMVCACADGNGWLAGLLFQIARANPRDQPQRQPLGGNGS